MNKKTDIRLFKDNIIVMHHNLVPNHDVKIEFEPVNKYQLLCKNIIIENKTNNQSINSTDFRKINIYNLVKKSVQFVDKNIQLDKKSYDKLKSKYNPNINKNKISKIINDKSYKNRDEFFALYSLLYIYLVRDFGDNISDKLSTTIKYKENYIRNITKEAFKKGFLTNSKKGLAGGYLTSKSLKILNSL